MFFNTHPEKFWNLLSKNYAASPISDRDAYEKKINKIKTFLSPDHKVLDIGCATGTQCGDIAPNVKQVTGIDISDKLLDIAKQRMADRNVHNINFIQATMFDERLEPGSFDVIMVFYVFHFIEDIDAAFNRINSLLKPGGIFISETSCLGEKSKIVGKIMRIVGRLGIMPLINLLTTAQLERALDRSGFSLLEKQIFGTSNNEYTLFAKKK